MMGMGGAGDSDLGRSGRSGPGNSGGKLSRGEERSIGPPLLTLAQLLLRRLQRRIAGKFQVREPHALVDHLVGAYGSWRFESGCCGGAVEIILLDAVAAHAQAAHQRAVLVKRQRAWKEHDSILIGIRRL